MAWVLIMVAGVALGRWVAAPLRLGDGLAAWQTRILAGLCVAGCLAMALGSHSLAVAQLALLLIALAALAGELFLRRGSRRDPEETAAGPPRAPLTPLDYSFLGATGAALGMSLLSALAPVTGWDAAVAHIALPQDYAREGRIFAHSGNVYSGYPHLMHSLYAVAYHGSGETAVTLLSWSFGALGCLSLFVLGRQLDSARAGYLAAAIFATAPVFLDQAGSVSVDLAAATLTVAALSALIQWRAEGKAGWLLAAALLAGSVCGARHTGYLVCALLLLATPFLAAHGKRARAAAGFAAVAGLAAAPWLLRSALVAGNPVFPFFLDAFPSTIPHIPITAVGAHESVHGGGMGLTALLRFPWDIVMRPQDYDGWTKSPGGLVLALGLAGLALGGWRARGVGAFSIAGGVAFFLFQRLARYILPFFAPMMAVAAVGAMRLRVLRGPVIAIVLVSLVYGLALQAAATHFKLPVLLGFQTQEEYLRARVERYPAFQYVNRYLTDGATLTVDQRSYYLRGPSHQNHWALLEISELPIAEQHAWLRGQGIHYVLLPWTFVEESGALRDQLLPMFRQWRGDPGRFELIESMHLERPRAPGREIVEIYAVRAL